MGERSRAFRKADKMNTDEIIKYYDDLMRLAVSKCGSSADAEDLVGDTMLAAFSYMISGGVIIATKIAKRCCKAANRASLKGGRSSTP